VRQRSCLLTFASNKTTYQQTEKMHAAATGTF
jgi:hypothetical protein